MAHEHLMAIYPYKLSHYKQDFCLTYRSKAKAQLQLTEDQTEHLWQGTKSIFSQSHKKSLSFVS